MMMMVIINARKRRIVKDIKYNCKLFSDDDEDDDDDGDNERKEEEDCKRYKI